MAKIFEFNGNKGSLIDQVSKTAGTFGTLTSGAGGFKKTEKGLAMEFDGATTSLTYPDSDILDGMTKLSIVVWIKPIQGGHAFHHIITKNYTNGYSFQYRNQDNAIFAYINSIPLIAPKNSIEYGKWQMFIFTYDSAGAGTGRIYKNNTLIVENTAYVGATVGANSNDLTISPSGNRLYGSVGKIQMFNTSLTQSERNTLYQEFLNASPTEKPVRGFELVKPTDLSYQKDRGLLAAYNFKRNGDTLVDISGNGYNFTIKPGTVERDNGLYFPMTRATITPSITFPAGSKTVCWRGVVHSIPGSYARIYSSYIMFSAAFNSFLYRSASDNIITLATGFTTADFNKEFDFVYVQEGNSSQKLYINGVLVSSSTETITSNQLIGEINSTTFSTGGYITYKDLRFYTRAFSEQEIKDYHNSFIKPVILEDFNNYPVGEKKPKEWQIISGEFEIKEDTEKKYLECTSTGTIKINHNTTTDADASIDYYDGASWTTFSGTLRDLITTHAWLSKDGNYLEFSLTSGKAIAKIKIYDGVRQ